ncbi:hypothetical protein RT99_05920 [Flavobacterium sp. MEB061]|uniref:hypothetical protein n=1 Tax=Flavobacterium sp. MEB061 TaxID=1587524 RepID=UPI0005AC1C05|nr:hypothetical protein [Flavobacterium sp. MEB061]KIQ22644.1 hypothetical protein RT99_05920 [Flavobacterium sp. MEB061]
MSILAANNVFPHDPEDNWKLKTDKGGYEGTSQDLKKQIDELMSPDDILVRGAITKDGNKRIIAPYAFTIRIDQVEYTNPDLFETTIRTAAEGHYRIDIFVFTKFSTIVKIEGDEGIESAQEPDTPNGTIKIGFNSVFGSIINEPEIPVPDNTTVKKIESQDFITNYGLTAIIEKIELLDERSSISLTGAVTDIKSIQTTVELIRPGKPFFIKNRTAHNVKIWHNSGTGNIKFFFPDGYDLLLKPNEILQFNLNANDLSNIKLELVGSNGNILNSIVPNSSISYTFKLSDLYKKAIIEHSSSSAITEIIPNNSSVAFPIGTVLQSVATGTGIRTTSGAAGVTIKTNLNLSSVQNEIRRFIKIDTNTWLIEGNIKKSNETFMIRDSHYSSALANSNWFFKVYTNALTSADSTTTDFLTAITSGASSNYMSIFEAPFTCEIVSITVSMENDWPTTGSFGFGKHKKKQSSGAGVPTNPEIIHEFPFSKGSYSQLYKKVSTADFGIKTINEGESLVWGWKGEIRYAKILIEIKKV